MARPYLFGPVSERFVDENLHDLIQSGECLAFAAAGSAGLAIGANDSWDDVLARLPAEWRPDFVVLDLHYTSIPACLWQAPVPIVGLAQDWNLLWHNYRRLLPGVDLVLTDRGGVERLGREGNLHARAANLFGLERGWADTLETYPTERDSDILFVGNLHPAVQRERLPWLARLAQLGERHRVSILQGVFGDEYRQLARRARIVFNRSIRGECNMRAFEAAAAGALLFQEAENLEVADHFRDRLECVYYTDENLESLLDYYLDHEEDRLAIAEAGRERVRAYTFANLWAEHLELIEREWPALQERMRRRCAGGAGLDLEARVWQACCNSNRLHDATLVADLETALVAAPERAELHQGLGFASAAAENGGNPQELVEHFQRAVADNPNDRLAGLNLVEALTVCGQRQPAIAEARRVLSSEVSRRGAEGAEPNGSQSRLPYKPEAPAMDRPSQSRLPYKPEAPAMDRPSQSRLPYKPEAPALDRPSQSRLPYKPEAPALDRPSLALQACMADADPSRLTACSAPLRETISDMPHYPLTYDFFRVEWERAAWSHAGEPAAEVRAKEALLSWRLHHLLGELTGELWHYYEAVLARPDLPTTQAALGCALARSGQPAAAVAHLRAAVRANPFDLPAARAWYQALGDSEDQAGQREAAAERALLARAAPQSVPVEPWFAGLVGWVSNPSGSVGRLPEPSCSLDGLETHPTRTAPRFLVPTPASRLAIIWEGDQLAVHSLAHVNRAIAVQLLKRGHELSLVATDRAGDPTASLAGDPRLLTCFQRPLTGAVDIHVRHEWPPRFTPPPPPAGPWVIFQHWEFGSLPRSWIEPMSRQVDEIWVASRWVRSCFIDSGIPAEQVQVIPLGVDPARFEPQAPALGLRTSKRFRFLFVGGTIQRKGIDVLLEAYGEAFKKSDDVCLVIKDMGVGTFYRDQTAEERIARFRSRPEAPEIEYINQSFTAEEMAGLYTACQCLVHPFRGEGFGLPIAEAMACGLPVIVTGYGPVLDYCQGSTAYMVPARLMHLPQKRIDDEATVDFPWLAEPDQELLQTWMRYVFAHSDQARALGAAASRHIHGQFTWEHTAAAVEQRVQALKQRSPRRERATVDDTASLTQEPDAQARDPASGGCEPPGTAPNRGIHTSDTAPNRGVHTPRSPGPSLARQACVCDLLYTGAPRRRRFSANLIVKNEESNLPGCLESLGGLFDEIIVVDTGSNDRTREIALEYGAEVFDFPWVDSFAAARNECLRHSTGDWIFWMDADDRLDDANRQELLALFAGLDGDHAAFAMQCLCAPAADTGVATAVQHVRLFRNHPQLRWEQRIHEQILPAVRRLGDALRFTDIQVQHTGYLDPALRCRKRERDLRLLLMEYAEQPQHPFTLFNLGMTYVDFQIPQVALPLLQRSLARSAAADSIVRKLHYLIVQCHRQLRQPAAALAACERGRADYPNDVELLSQEAQLRGEQGDFSGAETCYLQLLTAEESPHLASVPLGLKGFRTRHNLGVLYRQHDRHAEAETQWRLALAEQPDFLPSRLALEELYREQSRWMERRA